MEKFKFEPRKNFDQVENYPHDFDIKLLADIKKLMDSILTDMNAIDMYHAIATYLHNNEKDLKVDNISVSFKNIPDHNSFDFFIQMPLNILQIAENVNHATLSGQCKVVNDLRALESLMARFCESYELMQEKSKKVTEKSVPDQKLSAPSDEERELEIARRKRNGTY